VNLTVELHSNCFLYLELNINLNYKVMKHLKLFAGFLILSAMILVSCTKEENLIPENKGRLNVYLTDAPFPIGLVEHAFVTIDRVEVRQRIETEGEEDEENFIVIAQEAMEFDLLQLTNGITTQLAMADLEPGSYDMIRLHVVDARIVLTDGNDYDLKVPSGSSSGLKIKIEPAISIVEGQTSDVLLDFDISKSFVAKGNVKGGQILGFNFKPVVRGIYMGAAGRIQGTVTDAGGQPLENAWVKLLVPVTGTASVTEEGDGEDNVLVSAYTDASGNYKLIGLPEGIYSMECELEGFSSLITEEIEVKAGILTTVNFTLIAE
jgi:hypothetical protein